MKTHLFLILSVLVLSSCSKGGCTDPKAYNYDESAKKNSGCSYQGSNVFWYDQTTSTEMLNAGITSLRYYVDDELVGTSDPTLFWPEAPECGQNSSVTCAKKWENNSYSENSIAYVGRNFEYLVIDQDGTQIWSGILPFFIDACGDLQLVW